MGQLGFGLAAVALFGAAFGGTLWIAQPKGTTIASVAAADTVCNLAEEACRAQLRSEGERHLGAGRRQWQQPPQQVPAAARLVICTRQVSGPDSR